MERTSHIFSTTSLLTTIRALLLEAMNFYIGPMQTLETPNTLM